MSACLAEYAYEFSGWRWQYRLHLDRLESEGHGGGVESALQVYELSQYAEFPNRASYHLPTNRPATAIVGASLVGLALLGGVIWFAIENGGMWNSIKLFLVLGAMITVGTYKGLLKLTARKDWVTRADFRRLDGTELFSVWEINETQIDEFNVFMQKLQAVIQSSRPPTTVLPSSAAPNQ